MTKWTILIGFFLITRLVNLTLLPIFADEANYLDWGYRETHNRGYLFYSLYDNKPPLLMWAFGIAQDIFPDPLFGSRLVSMLTGLAAVLGIYFLTKKMFDVKTAVLAWGLYTVIPLFAFFDRQALMESAITAIGIWAGWGLVNLLHLKSVKWAVGLGMGLGIGMLVKTNVLLFLAAAIIILTIRKQFYLAVFVVMGFLIAAAPLLFQSQFWATASFASRFSLTVPELIKFPLLHWLENIWINIDVSFWQITPLVFIASLIGLVKYRQQRILLLWFSIPLGLQILIARVTTFRYAVSFLPLL